MFTLVFDKMEFLRESVNAIASTLPSGEKLERIVNSAVRNMFRKSPTQHDPHFIQLLQEAMHDDDELENEEDFEVISSDECEQREGVSDIENVTDDGFVLV